jgi:hypothetical protein
MKRLFIVLIFLVIALSGWGAWEVYKRYSAVFPTLSAGVYQGYIRFDGKPPLPWVVLQKKDDVFLTVSVGSADFSAQRARCTDPSGITKLPLVFEGKKQRFRLTGRLVGSLDGFIGRVYEAHTGQTGEWSLKRIEVAPLSVAVKQDLVQWASLMEEIQVLGEDLDGAQSVREERFLQKDIRDNVQIGTEGIGTAMQPNDYQSSGLKAFEALRDSTRYGRLVKLGRESLARDSVWITSAISKGRYETSSDFQDAWARTARVLELKDAIEQARRKVEAGLLTGDSGESEIEREHEFYQQFQ